MSEIRANTISDATGTGPIDLHKQSAAKAWVNYTPSSTTINDSVNVTSLVDNGVGDNSVNYTSSMASSNYVQTGAGTHGPAVTSANVVARPYSGDSLLTGSTRISLGFTNATSNYTPFDYAYAAMLIHGDLA